MAFLLEAWLRESCKHKKVIVRYLFLFSFALEADQIASCEKCALVGFTPLVDLSQVSRCYLMGLIPIIWRGELYWGLLGV